MRHGYGGGPLLGLLMVVVFLVVVGGLVWLAIRLFSSSGGGARPLPAAPPTPNALAILDDRLARGDLDVEEYRARRAALLEGFPPPPPPPAGSAPTGSDSTSG